MEKTYIEDKTFDKVDFTNTPINKGEYENCVFLNCDLSNSNLADIVFSNCEFNNCNISSAKITNTSFKNVLFKNCKMLGLHFESCNPFLLEFNFENCAVNLSSFYKLKLKKINFKNCNLQEVDFSEADLSQAIIDNCDLLNVTFDRTILEKTDLRTAYHYSIDAEKNNIKKAKFSLNGIKGLLDKYDIVVE